LRSRIGERGGRIYKKLSPEERLALMPELAQSLRMEMSESFWQSLGDPKESFL
jgi:hypothetical protein